jgi:hypothetical protein
MPTLHESLDTDNMAAEAYGPTAERSRFNRHEIVCADCGGHYFVDDATYERVVEALAFDPTSDAFVCDECETEHADSEHAH